MPKDGKLNDEEIRQLIKEANEQAQLYGDDGEPLPEKAIADAASKAMINRELRYHLNGTASDLV